ncbi:hypothetical protein [Streptomyces caniscabiei]|uniref:Uncharacterized protein n=1 Tax=Streptomyces caniscabiei TaxID=2746961 RepID=A0ABU4MKD6_9ACTN|nr:hypothetical protein [Streptomyces caniscabiei]MDX3009617.1 hypothetical protein [Streptomyces caniscabiei]MDX3037262.1 hypothetical protein [Streptomyces caniscabiei]
MPEYPNHPRIAQTLLDQQSQINALTAERDGVYRERAQLLALLAALHPSVIAPASDVDEDGWQILYLRIGGKQASWHIAPRDADLYAHVEHVPADDRRAQWDGHTTEQKYAHIGQHAAQLYAEARGRVDTPLTPGEATEPEKTARVFAALHQSAEQNVSRVIVLYERWVKAGPPPLGTSVSRWWDARLIELRAALGETKEQPSAPCEQHPDAVVIGGMCGGCTQYPSDMVKEH